MAKTLPSIDIAVLTNVVRQDQRSPVFEVVDWSVSTLSDQSTGNNDTDGQDASPISITSAPDLHDDGDLWSGFSPGTVEPGDAWSVWSDIRNDGGASSGGFYVNYYASTNTTISTLDYYLGQDYISNAAAGAYVDSRLDLASFPSTVERQ